MKEKLDKSAFGRHVKHVKLQIFFISMKWSLLVTWISCIGKFRHLPVVEHGEVIAMLDITKFLYDAISRMEKAAEQGSAIAAAMEGVERQWGNDFPGFFCFTSFE